MYGKTAVLVAYPQRLGTSGAYCRCRPQLPWERALKQETAPHSTLYLGAQVVHCPISDLCGWPLIAPSKLLLHCHLPGQIVAPGPHRSGVSPAEVHMYVQSKTYDYGWYTASASCTLMSSFWNRASTIIIRES